MDYKAFFADVLNWIGQANQMATKYGMANQEFWSWVANSACEICNRYDNNQLVLKQMMMLTEWLEEVYEKSTGKNTT